VATDHLVRCWLYHHADGNPRRDPDHWPEATTLADEEQARAIGSVVDVGALA
jgi:hypothetical protein